MYLIAAMQCIMSMSAALSWPFLPLYVIELGVHPVSSASMWAGIIQSPQFLLAAIVGPFWGTLADRVGRKAMVLRCATAMAIFTFLMGLSRNVGELFVFRDAGNFVSDNVLGTLEYGYGALGVKLIVVLGHESCGAIAATYDAVAENKPLPPNLDVLQHAIAPGIASVVAAKGSKQEAVVANVRAQAEKLKASPVLGPAIASGDCKVVAAEYRFHTGVIDFLK